MASSLYEIHDKTQPIGNAFAVIQVLADNYVQAVSLVRDYLWELLGRDVQRADLAPTMIETNLENTSWRVLQDGELYHPGAYVGVLSDYEGATRYEVEEEGEW